MATNLPYILCKICLLILKHVSSSSIQVMRLAAKVDGLIDALVAETHHDILRKCGVAAVIHLMDSHKGQVLPSVEGLDPLSLQVS